MQDTSIDLDEDQYLREVRRMHRRTRRNRSYSTPRPLVDYENSHDNIRMDFDFPQYIEVPSVEVESENENLRKRKKSKKWFAKFRAWFKRKKKNKKKEEIVEVEFEKVSKILSESVIDENNDNTTCIICMDATIDTLLYPCCHLELCYACSEMINECSTCRKPIENRFKVYSPFSNN